ncbi:MAG TPA: cytochrome c-type biogenesis protein [Thermodesulfobacteriota bacterium]|jgi:cytochrome c-type biogenesis protein CcmH|nr:cytochrome c-type biogenesis protein [Thermodesulfobacteriota bacterium]
MVKKKGNCVFRWVPFLIALTVLCTGFPTSDSPAETIDDRVSEVSNLLMCPVCQGQTVKESNSQLAKDMRAIIKKKLEEGKSKEEIIAYFVDRYGETILAAPPAKGTNWILWLLPAFTLLAGGIAIVLFLYWSKGEESEKMGKKPEEPLIRVEPKYVEELDKELRNLEP